MPPELVWLPPRVPLNLYDFACWARGTVAPLLIVLSHRPRRPLPFSLVELVLPGTESRLRKVDGHGPFAWTDYLLKRYDRLRVQPGRAAARRRLVGWISDRQEADGSWGGIQPPRGYSLIALPLQVVARGGGGGGRGGGGLPPPLGVLADRAPPRGDGAGPPGDAPRAARAARLCSGLRRGMAAACLHVSGVGHRTCGSRSP